MADYAISIEVQGFLQQFNAAMQDALSLAKSVATQQETTAKRVADTSAKEAKRAGEAQSKEAKKAAADADKAWADFTKSFAKQAKEQEAIVKKASSSGANQLEKLLETYEDLVTKTTAETKATKEYALALDRLDTKIADVTKRMASNKGRSLSELFDQQNLTNVVTAGVLFDKQVKTNLESSRKFFDALETSTGALKLPLSGMFGSMRDISSALGDMQEAAGTGSVALLGVGVAAGAALAAVLALVGGVIALGAGIVSATAHGAEMADQLRKIDGLRIVDPRQIDSLETAAASIEAIGAMFKRFTVEVATKFGPVVKEAATLLVAMGLAGLDAFKSMGEGASLVRVVFQETFKGILNGALSIFGFIGSALSKTGLSNFAAAGKGLELLAGQAKKFADEFGTAAGDAAYDKMSEGFAALTARFKEYIPTAEKVIGSIKRVNVANREASKDAKDAADKAKELAEKALEARAAQNALAVATIGGGASLAGFGDQVQNGVNKLGEWYERAASARNEAQLFIPVTAAMVENIDLLNGSLEKTKFTSAEISAALGSIGQIASNVGLGGIGNVVGSIQAFADASTTLEKVAAVTGGIASTVGIVIQLLDQLAMAVTGSGLGDLIAMGADGGKKLGAALAKIDLEPIFTKLVDGLTSVVVSIAENADKIIMSLFDAILAVLPTLLTKLVPALVIIAVKFVEAIVANIPLIIVALVDAIPQIMVALALGLASLILNGIAAVLSFFGLDEAAAKVRGVSAGFVDTALNGGSMTGGNAPVSGQSVSTAGATSTGSAKGYNYGRGSSDADMQVTDAVVSASGSRRTINMAAGDAGVFYQQGGVNDLGRNTERTAVGVENLSGLIAESNRLLKEIKQALRRGNSLVLSPTTSPDRR